MYLSVSKILSQPNSPSCRITEIPDQFTLTLSLFWIIPRASSNERNGRVTDGFLQKAFPKATQSRLHHIILQHPALQVLPVPHPWAHRTLLHATSTTGAAASGTCYSIYFEQPPQTKSVLHGQRLIRPGPEQNSQALTTVFFSRPLSGCHTS